MFGKVLVMHCKAGMVKTAYLCIVQLSFRYFRFRMNSLKYVLVSLVRFIWLNRLSFLNT